jgi:hypothetical protein
VSGTFQILHCDVGRAVVELLTSLAEGSYVAVIALHSLPVGYEHLHQLLHQYFRGVIAAIHAQALLVIERT